MKELSTHHLVKHFRTNIIKLQVICKKNPTSGYATLLQRYRQNRMKKLRIGLSVRKLKFETILLSNYGNLFSAWVFLFCANLTALSPEGCTDLVGIPVLCLDLACLRGQGWVQVVGQGRQLGLAGVHLGRQVCR